MKAHYGYEDGSGAYFITIDTALCDGCAECVDACPADLFEVGEDVNDPFRDEPVALVKASKTRNLRYECAPCKPGAPSTALACMAACEPAAIEHSW